MPIDEVKVHMRDGIKVIEVPMEKVKYHQIPWVDCSEFQKRKYENFIFLKNQERNRIKFIYQ